MMLLPKKFPKDADGRVLKMLYKEGLDFNKPQQVEFIVAVPDEKNGELILKEVMKKGFTGTLEQDEEEEEWTCYCLVDMLLTHEGVVDIQKQLDEISEPYEGYSDGWGVLIK